ncbi:hypothetical protein [Aliarcobacter cryaerophilus]|jgi:hypothetical protein|uniref:hypothetical protein n=1 Tax=Aliarcobacter cryaerophilus TaxID=28198 RepID=UPI003DA68B2C
MKTRKILASKIAPSSIIGEQVEIISRHIVLPFQKIQYKPKEKNCEDIKFFFTGKIIDNSEVIIKKITERTCFENNFTLKKENDKIKGIEISIKSSDKVRENDITKVKESGRHNAQRLSLSKFTFAELIKEERDIINSSNYKELKEIKIKIESKINNNTFIEF